MQVLLQSEPKSNGTSSMAEHVGSVLHEALDRFDHHVTRVEAHLADAPGDEVHCTLEARLQGAVAVVVKDQAGSAHQALAGAVRKLKRAVGAAIAKQDPRRPSRASAVDPLPAVSAPADTLP